jgi:hypothetical protein
VRASVEDRDRAPHSDRDDEETLRALRTGELEILGLLPRSSNYTFLTRVRTAEDTDLLGVYKPRAGETPLWDFPDGTLCGREVAAYTVSRALGWPHVPPTVLRDGPEGVGSVQRFVEFDPSEHYFTLRPGRDDDYRKIALFDAVVNNADRKGGHTLLGKDGGIFVIDHGVCFSTAPKLRTVIWDFAGEPIPQELSADLERLRARIAGDLRPELSELLRAAEIDAVADRIRTLLAAGCFPHPVSERAYPWPPV